MAELREIALEMIVKHRETREGKPFKFTKAPVRVLSEVEEDAVKAKREVERTTRMLNDSGLLSSALANECIFLEQDEGMLAFNHADDKPMAEGIVDFRKDTVQIIEDFIRQSPLKQAILQEPFAHINSKVFGRFLAAESENR